MTWKDYANIVKQNLPAEKVARGIGLEVTRGGFCKCPFHADKTASMKLYPGSRGWYCFGCHAGGSVIDLVMAYYGLDMRGAVELLNDQFGLRLPIGHKADPEQEKKAREIAEKLQAEREARDREEREAEKAFLRWCDIGKEISECDDIINREKTREDIEFSREFVDAVLRREALLREADDLSLIFNRVRAQKGGMGND